MFDLLASWTYFPAYESCGSAVPERGDAYRASYSPYYFPGSDNDVSVIWEDLLEITRLTRSLAQPAHSEVVQVPTSTMLLVCTRPFEQVISLLVSTA